MHSQALGVASGSPLPPLWLADPDYTCWVCELRVRCIRAVQYVSRISQPVCPVVPRCEGGACDSCVGRLPLSPVQWTACAPTL